MLVIQKKGPSKGTELILPLGGHKGEGRAPVWDLRVVNITDAEQGAWSFQTSREMIKEDDYSWELPERQGQKLFSNNDKEKKHSGGPADHPVSSKKNM